MAKKSAHLPTSSEPRSSAAQHRSAAPCGDFQRLAGGHQRRELSLEREAPLDRPARVPPASPGALRPAGASHRCWQSHPRPGRPSRRPGAFPGSGQSPKPGAYSKSGSALRRSRSGRIDRISSWLTCTEWANHTSGPTQSSAFHVRNRAVAKLFQAEGFFILGLSQVGVQVHAVLARQGRRSGASGLASR